MEHHSAEEIQAQIEQVKQEQYALERAFEARLKEEKKAFVEELKQIIAERGYQQDDIAEQLGGRQRKQRGKRPGAGSGNYTQYVDPDNPENVYIRGRMPYWLIEKMAANGYDPENAEQRQQFKEEHLQKIAA
ncbi:H-NS histone family protein [Lamprobacter modestohalophilus]|nr:H-NS histone family protein [Lamprobacter modestohalophilus]MEA1051877.1 H-NS histone family protein [Lamprobacter modestohalophilus]